MLIEVSPLAYIDPGDHGFFVGQMGNMKNVTLGLFAVLALGLGIVYGAVRIRSELGLGRQPTIGIPIEAEKHRVSAQMLATSESNQGKRAPDFEAESSDGKMFSRDELIKDRPLVVIFIKETCPCSSEADPFFRKLFDAVGASVNVVGVIDGGTPTARNWVEKHKTPYPVLADPEFTIVHGFGAENSAYVALVDQKGVTVRLWPGYSAGMLDELVERCGSMTGRTFDPIDVKDAPAELYSGCPYF